MPQLMVEFRGLDRGPRQGNSRKLLLIENLRYTRLIIKMSKLPQCLDVAAR